MMPNTVHLKEPILLSQFTEQIFSKDLLTKPLGVWRKAWLLSARSLILWNELIHIPSSSLSQWLSHLPS